MKGHLTGLTVFVCVVIAMVVFFAMAIMTGYITVQVTGQPTIDSLTHQLTACQTELTTKCPVCPPCPICGGLEWFGGVIVGVIIGFFFFLLYGKDLKEYLMKKWGKK